MEAADSSQQIKEETLPVNVANELYRLAMFVGRSAPNLTMDVPVAHLDPTTIAGAAAASTSSSTAATAGDDDAGTPSRPKATIAVESPYSVAATLEKLLKCLTTKDGALATAHPSQPSRLLASLGMDMLIEIFTWMEPRTTPVTMLGVNVSIRKLILGSEMLWSSVCEVNFPCWYSRYNRSGAAPHQLTKAVPGQSKWYQRVQQKLATDSFWLGPRDGYGPVKAEERNVPRGLHCIYFDHQDLFCGAGANNEVIVLDLKTGKRRQNNGANGLYGHTAAVSAIQPIEQDSNLLLTGSLDGTMHLWDRDLMYSRATFRGHTDKIWCVQTAGSRVFSGGSDKTVKIWDLESAKPLATLKDHRTSISALSIMRNGNSGVTLVTGSAGNTIRVWDISQATAVCTTKLRGHDKGVFCLHCTPSMLLSASLDNTMGVWDPRCNYKLVTFLMDESAKKVSSSPPPAPAVANLSGSNVLPATLPSLPGGQPQPSVLGAPTGPTLPPVTGAANGGQNGARNNDENSAGIITFSVDDTKVVSGGPEQVIKLWDLRMFRLVHRFEGHSHWVTSLQFDDDKIVSASRDKTIRFWDVSGKMKDSITIPTSPI